VTGAADRPPRPSASRDSADESRWPAPARPTPAGVSPAIIRQVKLLELRTRRLVNSVFTGEYRSVFKGQGIEFAEVREYLPGDEVRTIDWNVTARMGRPFVKRYIEERELTILLAVDISGSERFGTATRFKVDVASELAVLLAMSAVRNNDRVGAVLFTDRIELVVPPRKGRRHAMRVIRELLAPAAARTGTDLAGALAYLTRLLTHRTIVFVMSDFQASGFDRSLSLLGQRHDVIAVSVEDPGERLLPDVGLVRFADPETGAVVDVDTSAPAVRAFYARRAAEERVARQQLFRQLAIDEIVVGTDSGVVDPLLKFFRRRETRARRRTA
jgi:uncharacterized protein (DUF58 family)